MKLAIVAILSILFLSGCALVLSKSKNNECDREIPEQVKKFFDSSNKPKFSGIINDASIAYSIVRGTNKDFFMDNNGNLISREHGWQTKIKFEPTILFENESYLLIHVSSGVRISSYAYIWMVIRKTDGKIIQSFKSGENSLEEIIFDDVYYFKIGYDDPHIYCMKIGE